MVAVEMAGEGGPAGERGAGRERRYSGETGGTPSWRGPRAPALVRRDQRVSRVLEGSILSNSVCTTGGGAE